MSEVCLEGAFATVNVFSVPDREIWQTLTLSWPAMAGAAIIVAARAVDAESASARVNLPVVMCWFPYLRSPGTTGPT